MINKEVLDAECKDINSYNKSMWRTVLKKGIITVSATILIGVAAFQQGHAQTKPDTRDIAQKMADAWESDEFKKKSVNDQHILMIQWMEALSDSVQKDFSKHIMNGEFNDAEIDLEFYNKIAKETGDKVLREKVGDLKTQLDHAKKVKYQDQTGVRDKIKHNKLETGSIQEIGGELYATYTVSFRYEGNARLSAKKGLENFMKKNNLKTDNENPYEKVTPQYSAYTVTDYMHITK